MHKGQVQWMRVAVNGGNVRLAIREYRDGGPTTADHLWQTERPVVPRQVAYRPGTRRIGVMVLGRDRS